MPELSPALQQWVNIVMIWVGFGSLAGLVARVILPAGEPSGALPMLALGITGSAVGLGVLSYWIADRPSNPIGPLGFLAATIGAMTLLVGYRVLQAIVPRPAEDAAAEAETEDAPDEDEDEDEDDEEEDE
jgi:uncharacterized membrane protein YeaQ/YmgE (transglycosylase-associated protein family)